MKKQTLKNLSLHKKTISSLEGLQKVHGGDDSFWPETVKFCPIPPEPEPLPPTKFPGDVCDIPT
ncbi:hypothetical protein U8527_01850 [Kordia algicida OT-1]|uniref:Uncharacterized protein n=1 Tax=Kordia algicida OT-1 TaxID=391587 RepID=A9DTA4_9FLAO|nr:hypothetical protein [Kordia algicida]EDP97046.1 hypothetical protein KAOT1_17823 [Kordia algicida OT-1]